MERAPHKIKERLTFSESHKSKLYKDKRAPRPLHLHKKCSMKSIQKSRVDPLKRRKAVALAAIPERVRRLEAMTASLQQAHWHLQGPMQHPILRCRAMEKSHLLQVLARGVGHRDEDDARDAKQQAHGSEQTGPEGLHLLPSSGH